MAMVTTQLLGSYLTLSYFDTRGLVRHSRTRTAPVSDEFIATCSFVRRASTSQLFNAVLQSRLVIFLICRNEARRGVTSGRAGQQACVNPTTAK